MKQFSKTLVPVALCLSIAAITASAADRVRIVNEGGIRDEWMLADGVKLAAPGYPADFVARGDSVCVAMGYSIKPDGTTSDFAVLKAWNSSAAEKEPVAGFWDAFTQSSAHALSQWKFKPRPEVKAPQATYTVATMNFTGKNATDTDRLRGRCAIADLPQFVQQQKSSDFISGRDKQDMDNMRRAMDRQNAVRASSSAMGSNSR